MSSLPLAPLPWPDPVCADLYGFCINKSGWLSRNCSFTWNLHRIPGLHPLFSWGLGVRTGNAASTAPQLPVSAHPFFLSLTPAIPKAPQPCSNGSNRPKQTWRARSWSSYPGCRPRTCEGQGGRGTGPTLPQLEGRRAFWGHRGCWDKGLCQQGP